MPERRKEMLIKAERPKLPNIRERQAPRTIQELLDRYDLDNIGIYEYLDYMVDELLATGNGISREEIIEELRDLLENTVDYRNLSHLPSIEGVTLLNNKTLDSLGIVNDKNYVHQQNTASAIWTINHNLNKYPVVTALDSAGNEVIGDIEYIDTNNLKITFKGAFKGKATLN